MEYQAFTEGVRHGSVTTSHEVVILICYILSQSENPVSLVLLRDILLEEELVNYFEYTSAIEHLNKMGHLIALEKDKYILSSLGVSTAKTFGGNIPVAVKDRAVSSLEKSVKIHQREEENKVTIEKTTDGYEITLTITDIGTSLLSLKLFMPTKVSCENIRKRFLNDPLHFYTAILALSTGDIADNFHHEETNEPHDELF